MLRLHASAPLDFSEEDPMDELIRHLVEEHGVPMHDSITALDMRSFVREKATGQCRSFAARRPGNERRRRCRQARR